MKKVLFSTALSVLFILVVSFWGCKSETRNITEPNTDPIQTVNADGQISGRIINNFTNTPLKGVIVSISYNNQNSKATTDDFGHFTFSGVPVTKFVNEYGQSIVSGSYPVTLSLSDVNSKQSDPTKKYRDYYYKTLNVMFTATDSLMITNMVATIDLGINYCNTTVNGFVVDKNNVPAANAIVYFYDQSISNSLIAQTETDAAGKYTFENIDNGIVFTLKAITSDGSMEANLSSPHSLDPKITVCTMRSDVSSERLELRPMDNRNPFVVLITPEYNSDILVSNDFNIVFTFSEPVKQTQYSRTGIPKGLSSMIDDIIFTYDGIKKISGDIGIKLSWNNSFTALTITPSDALTSGRYTLDLRSVLSKFKDSANNNFVDNSNISGDFNESLKFTISQNLVTTGVPEITLDGILNFNGGAATIRWSSYSDPNAIGFNVYRSMC